MKKIALALLLACAVALVAWASAEEAYEYNKLYHTDLDGDGTLECWGFLELTPGQFNEVWKLEVVADDGAGERAEYLFETTPTDFNCRIADLDGDGTKEMLFSMETGEDMTYTTWCLRYVHGVITEVLFAEDDYNNSCYFPCDGWIHSVEGNRVTIQGYVDILGSWMAMRDFELADNGRLTPMNGGWLTRDTDFDSDDMDPWEYRSLTLSVETAYQNGDEVGILAVGDSILITGSDGEKVVTFITQDGREGQLCIMSPSVYYPGWLVNRNKAKDFDDKYIHEDYLYETDFFEWLPYGG